MQIRQGDVLLVKVDVVLDGSERVVQKGKVTLAEGETTGHAHTVQGQVALLERDGRSILFVEAPTEVLHQEHGSIPIAPGLYFVVRQREYTPERIHNVAD